MRLIKAYCFMVTLSLVTTTALAQWVDPLQTPAQTSAKAHTALLLDITQAGERLVAVGAFGHILYSDDQGASWQQAQVPVSVTLTAVSFADARHGWAVGHDGIILATEDGGLNWRKQLDG
ncbi:WD40/YVTN/BNR-like repeat-containing protein, partial [Gilvimarinus sp. 1_MG-2023]